MAVGLAGLEEGVITPSFQVHCSGGATFYGRRFGCWKKGGHGTVDLRHAIEQSCDVYFYTVGNMLGVDRINKWATLFGLGVKSNIDLPNELVGLVPSTEWKATQKESKWYAGETISVAIGQGQVAVTPVSMAVYAATLANGGTRITPHIVKAMDDGTGLKPVPPPAPQSKVDVTPGEARRRSATGMWGVVNGGGTGGRARIEGHDVCGKTGTAQVISNKGRVAAQAARTRSSRQRLVRVLRAARQPGDRRCRVPRARHPRPECGRRWRITFSRRYFAKHDGKPLPPPPTHDRTAPRLQGSVRPQRQRRASGRRATSRCSNGASTSTSTGCCSAPSCCSPASGWR